MTFGSELKSAAALLAGAGVENADAEALWMLSEAAGIRESLLLARMADAIPAQQAEKFRAMISLRAQGTPVQYILGSWDFRGREYRVGEGVLIPRPETEGLVDIALGMIKDNPSPVIIDLCAGTGCIGLSIALEKPGSEVYLVEKYDGAFRYLEMNCEGVANAHPVRGDVLAGLEGLNLPEADLLVSNPPYVTADEMKHLQREVLREPAQALLGGEDGLDFYRAIKEMMPRVCKGRAVFETGEKQGEALKEIFPGALIEKDCYGNDRYAVIGE